MVKTAKPLKTPQQIRTDHDLLEIKRIVNGYVQDTETIVDGQPRHESTFTDGARIELTRDDSKEVPVYTVSLDEDHDYADRSGRDMVGASRMVLRFTGDLEVLDAEVGRVLDENDDGETPEFAQLRQEAIPGFVDHMLRHLEVEL